jgi:hypothetical protein
MLLKRCSMPQEHTRNTFNKKTKITAPDDQYKTSPKSHPQLSLSTFDKSKDVTALIQNDPAKNSWFSKI